jgi:hypothetical protein
VLCALIVGALFTCGAVFILPLALLPFVYVTALVAGVERRRPWSALVRGVRIAKGVRSEILGLVNGLWILRVALSTMIVVVPDDEPGTLIVGTIAVTLVNVLLTGLFASVNVAFYQAMIRRNDNPAVELSRVFE